MALFHLLFELGKIAILASVYATILWFIFRSISFFKPSSWINRVSAQRGKFWFRSGFLISAGLFIFMTTYFGDHGLGDIAIVPIGHFKSVYEGDGMYTYIQTHGRERVFIHDFAFDNTYLYARLDHTFGIRKNEFIVWNLRTNVCTFFPTRDDYLLAVHTKGYIHPENFEVFRKFYKEHWGGWRFWLLP